MAAGAVFTFRVVFKLAEVVCVLFQRVARIQQGFITDRDGRRIADAEVNTSRLLTRRVSGFNANFADEVQFPVVTVPDDADLLYRRCEATVLGLDPEGEADILFIYP